MNGGRWIKTIRLMVACCLCMSVRIAMAQDPAAPNLAAEEFFERNVRPILVENCQKCHGEAKQEGELRLTEGKGALAGGSRGPAIVPGNPTDSLLIQAVEYEGELQMPPSGKLTNEQIERLKSWVANGAVWPVTPTAGDPPPSGDEHGRWWSYQPVRSVTPPGDDPSAWAQTPIDRFILAGLKSHDLAPAPPADWRVLLRRVTFDLTGLPPTPDEVDAFVADESPDAFARVVDRLLASPAYGERWARHWLDVVRYADFYDANPSTRTASCEITEAWRYRDWVVGALNRDLPYDQFIVHQIAGDLLPSPDGQDFYADGLVATTFLSNGVWDRGDADKEKIVSDMVDDQIDTIGKAFMGLTLGCARCHDHKFDPVLQEDYYALAGIFYSTHILQELGTKGGEYTMLRTPLAPSSQVELRKRQEEQLAQVQAKLAELEKQQPPPPENDPTRQELTTQRDQIQREMPPPFPLAMAAREGGTPGGLWPNIQDVPIHIRGSYERLGPVVPRRMPRFLAGDSQPPIQQGSGRRELADWVASAANPLTARVIVNRIWQHHFGEGIVRTSSNFGKLGEPPSHPQLLDWLSAAFVEDGWSLKQLHRRILLSAVYQQSSLVEPGEVAKDPDNRWLGRYAPRRLEAEAIRDAMLCVSGRLDLARGGPAADDLTTARRSLYVQTARWDRSNFATLFDAANPDSSIEKRSTSTVAPQSLFLLDHDFVIQQAQHLALRLQRQFADDDARIEGAYRLLYGRRPEVREIEIGRQFLARAARNGSDIAWVDYAHLLLCSNELIYID